MSPLACSQAARTRVGDSCGIVYLKRVNFASSLTVVDDDDDVGACLVSREVDVLVSECASGSESSEVIDMTSVFPDAIRRRCVPRRTSGDDNTSKLSDVSSAEPRFCRLRGGPSSCSVTELLELSNPTLGSRKDALLVPLNTNPLGALKGSSTRFFRE